MVINHSEVVAKVSEERERIWVKIKMQVTVVVLWISYVVLRNRFATFSILLLNFTITNN